MVQGQRARAVPGAARRAFAGGLSRAVRGRRGARLSHAPGRLGITAVSEAVHGGDSLAPRHRTPASWGRPTSSREINVKGPANGPFFNFPGPVAPQRLVSSFG